MSDKMKFICFAGFAGLMILWFVLVLCGLAPAVDLITFIHTGLLALGSAILALINPGSLSTRITSAQDLAEPIKPLAPQQQEPTADQPAPSAIQPIPGADKPGQSGFSRLEMLGFMLIGGWGAMLLLSACVNSAAPSLPAYTPPAQCTGAYDNATGKYLGADSEILKVLPNPTAVGVALQLGDVAAIRSGAYKAADALKVIDEIDAAVAAATDYGTLATYVSGKLADANTAAGTAVFVNSGLLAQFTSRAVISDCDRAIILRHTAAQRAVIKALAGGK